MNEIKKKKDVDRLKRQEFVKMLEKLTGKIAEDGMGCTFAINGIWGSGKTFVLDYFEEQIDKQEKFLIIKYNCWKYDYYEEPLFAIIANLISFFENQKSLDAKIKVARKRWAKGLLSVGNDLAQKWIGVDSLKAGKSLINDNDSYDQYYKINESINKIRDYLSSISDKQKIILIVDELDRCLPDYAIKVLERLHHVSYELKNVIVIIGIDGVQLEKTIKKVFGDNTDTEKYMRKFVDFTLNLDMGQLDENWFDIYKENLQLPNNEEETLSNEFMTIISSFIKELSAREQEKIFRKNKILSNIISSELNLSSYDEFMAAFTFIYLMLNEYYIEDSYHNQKFKWIIEAISKDGADARIAGLKFRKSDKKVPYKLLKEIKRYAVAKSLTSTSPGEIRYFNNNLWGKIFLCFCMLNFELNEISSFNIKNPPKEYLNCKSIDNYNNFVEKVQCWSSFL